MQAISMRLMLVLLMLATAGTGMSGEMAVVVADDCGARGQTSLRQGSSWTIQDKEWPGTPPDEAQLRTFNYDSKAVVLEYAGLTVAGDFRVTMTFYNVVHERTVSLRVNDQDVATDLDLVIGERIERSVTLPPTAIRDGTIRIVVTPSAGHSAIISAVRIETDGKQPANVHERLLAATGGRNVRVVWGRYPNGKRDEGGMVMGYDAATGKEHVIVKGPIGCVLPRITDDGERVIFSDIKNKRAYVVNWDGSGGRVIGEDPYRFAATYWRDPETGVEWVYYGMPVWKAEGDPAVVRRRLDGTGKPETVWDKTSLGYMFGLSADGKRAGGELGGWPKQQVANLEDGSYSLYGQGCVGNMSPDDSYRYFYFEGNHVKIQMFDANRTNRRTIAINFPTNGAKGREAWPIRWSSDVRFIGLSGPWSSHNKWAPANVYIGQFNSDLTAIGQWFQITNTPEVLDYEPYVWIAPGDTSTAATTRPTRQPATVERESIDTKPADHDAGLLFHWESGDWQTFPVIAYDESGSKQRDLFLDMDGQSHLGYFREMIIRPGSFRAPGSASYISTQVNRSKAFTMSILIQPDHWDRPGPRQILALTKGRETSVALAQHHDWLGLKVQTVGAKPVWHKLVQMKDHARTHVSITLADKAFRCYLNGEMVLSGKMASDVGEWTATDVVVGSGAAATRPWQGEAESIRLYDRALSDAEIAAIHRAVSERTADRTRPEQLVVKARLTQRTEVLKAEDMTYAKGLALFEYEVEKVEKGTYEETKLYVYHWTLMDKRIMPIATRKIGDTYTLILEPFDAHGELANECQSNTLDADDIDLDFTLYYDIER